MRRLCLTGLAVVLLAAACAPFFELRKEEIFEDTTKHYARLISWSEFEAAMPYMAASVPKERSAVPADVRVSDYAVKQIVYSEDKQRVLLTVRIGYFRQSNPKLRTLEDLQIWEFNPDREAWLLKSGFPDFK
jgi:hypothetical protein